MHRARREVLFEAEGRDFADVLLRNFHVGSVHRLFIEPDDLERIRGATDDELPLVGARRILPTTR